MKRLLLSMREPSYKRKLFLYFLLLSITPVILLGSVSSHIASRSIQDEVNLRHKTVLNQIQHEMNLFLRSITKSSMLISSNPTIESTFEVGPSMRHLDLSLSMIQQLGEYKVTSDVDFEVSLVYNRFGTVYSTRYGLIPVEQFPFMEALKRIDLNFNSFEVIPPGQYANQNDLLLVRGVPLTAEAFTGRVVLHVETKQLTDFLNRLNADSSKKTIIIDEQERIVLSSDPGEIGSTISGLNAIKNLLHSDIYQGAFTLHGEQHRMSAVKSMFNGWTYVTFTPMSELTEKSDQIRVITWTIASVMLLLWLGLSFVASNRMYFPIKRLLSNVPGYKNPRPGHGRDGLNVLDEFMDQMVRANRELQDKLKHQTPLMIENLCQKLLLGEIRPQELETGALAHALRGPAFCVCVAEIDRYYKLAKTCSRMELSNYFHTLRKMLEHTGKDHGLTVIVVPLMRQIVMIVDAGDSPDRAAPLLLGAMAQYRKEAANSLNFSVTVAVSPFRDGVASITECYQEAVGLMSYRLYLGHDTTIRKEQIRPSLKHSGLNLVKLQKDIASAVVQEDEELARRKLSEMIGALPELAYDSETVYGLFVYIIGEVTSLVQELGHDPQQVIGDSIYKQLYEFETLTEMEQWFSRTVFSTIIEKLREEHVSKQKKVVQRVRQYVREHYDAGLSMKDIADEVGVSQSQLSRMFKEEMQLSYSDYVMNYRMEKAKEWLTMTDMPIKEIAAKLSYASVQNFTRTFRQMNGVPPAKYRENARSDDSS
ncbi:helix-turn-helix domain-containing protein [Paenibacillus senegalensis]|uniref:helix-turn-helix domain-containing protein n=1 Tax=Paenibacillus senegalensis TaxID=1465766 RepID=UPI000289EC20|nr:helix-turn-helix domain-containing protein [Paenibacillus senegalensis]